MLSFPPTVEVAPGIAAQLHRRRLLLIFHLRRRVTLESIDLQLRPLGLRRIGTARPGPPVLTHAQPQPTPVSSTAAVNHSNGHLWIEDALGRDVDASRLEALESALSPELDHVAPVYRAGTHSDRDEQLSILPRVLLIEPAAGASDKLDRVIESVGGVVDIERSRYLGPFVYVTLPAQGDHPAFSLRTLLAQKYASHVRRLCYEQMPLASPFLFTPDDPEYWRQWNLTQIHAPRAWDVTRGAGVTVAIIDSGCDMAHPDLRLLTGFNADTLAPDGSPVLTDAGARRGHGTWVAGIVGARINNGIGVAGLAGEASLLPIASSTFSDAAVAIGIGFASVRGARVINMSFATVRSGFWTGPLAEAITNAERAGCVICASSGNADIRGLATPAVHPRVIAVGGNDRAGGRWRVTTAASPVGSNYGDEAIDGEWTGVSVVAPAEMQPTTDLVGSGSAHAVGTPLHGYQLNFSQTSAAAAHVSAAAALVIARFPALTPAEVRRTIEQSAEKVGSIAYGYVSGFTSGTRNEELGHGRVHSFHALRMADMFIRDWPGDRGREPSNPPGGNFFSQSDIVLRLSGDDTFRPEGIEASVLEPGRDHVIAVRATNRGPAIAHDVRVDVRVSPFVGLEFHYPDDWSLEDDLHIRPAAETGPMVLEAGADAIATFALGAAEVDRVALWSEARWHPCILASVTSPADLAFDPARIDARAIVPRFNNLAQRNLSILRTTSGRLERFPFLIGHPRNTDDNVELAIDSDVRLSGQLRIWLAGSDVRLPRLTGPANPTVAPKVLKAAGGKVGRQGARSWVDLSAPTVRLTLSRTPGRRQWIVLDARMPNDLAPGERLAVHLKQQRQGVTLGGATVVFTPAPPAPRGAPSAE